MAIQVKAEKEFFTPEMLDYLEKSKKVCEERFAPYRRVINDTPWTKLRVTMPDMINNLFKDIKDNGLLGCGVPKEYGGLGWNQLQMSLTSLEKIRIGRSGEWDSFCNTGQPGATCMRWAKDPEVRAKYMRRLASGAQMCYFLTDPEAGIDTGS